MKRLLEEKLLRKTYFDYKKITICNADRNEKKKYLIKKVINYVKKLN